MALLAVSEPEGNLPLCAFARTSCRVVDSSNDFLYSNDCNHSCCIGYGGRKLHHGFEEKSTFDEYVYAPTNDVLADIRAKTTVVTFTRKAGTDAFDTTATYEGEGYTTVNATITSNDSNFSSLKIEVSNLANGYTVYLNGGEDPVADDDIYPPQTSQG